METKTEETSKSSIPEMMKAIPFLSACKPEALKIVDWPTPKVERNEVLIRVHAFGINFADILSRKGQYGEAPPFPFVPGYEACGVVVDVGADVDNVQIGEKVLAFTNFGGYAQYSKMVKEAVVSLPEGWTFAQGAAIPVAFATAYHSIEYTGLPLQKEDKVLIQACAGGVGQAALQLLRLKGCTIFGTCGSDKKVEMLKSKGVDHPINYNTKDFVQVVKNVTNNEGVDFILDSVGGSSFKKDMSLLAPQGRLVGIGAAVVTDRSIGNIFSVLPAVISMLTLSSVDMMMNSRGFYGVNMKRIGDKKPQLLRKTLLAVVELFKSGALKIEDQVIEEAPWTEVGKIHHKLENRQTTGKLVLVVPDDI